MSNKLDWKAALWSGLIAGAVFMMMEMVLVANIGAGSPWGPPRMIAALLLGNGVLPPPATFDLGILIVAMMIHFPLSVVFATLLGWVVSHWKLGLLGSIAGGAIYGVIIYLVNFYGFTAIFPWFAGARTPITLLSHLTFGLIMGWAYHAFAVRHFAHSFSDPNTAN